MLARFVSLARGLAQTLSDRHSWATLLPSFLTLTVSGLVHGQELLRVYDPSLTSSQPQMPSTTAPSQPVSLTWLHRAAFLDGTVRESWGNVQGGANPGDPGAMGEATFGNVRLSTGEYAPTEVDIALPCAGPTWFVGRTRSPLYQAGRVHGMGWFQTSQPELIFKDSTGDSDDRVYIVFGGDRYLEFLRVVDEGIPTNVFRGINGTAGAVDLTNQGSMNNAMNSRQSANAAGGPGQGEVPPSQLWTFHDPIGNTASFFGSDASYGGHVAKWQLWKYTDAAGQSSFVGDASDLTAALTSGYDGFGRITQAWDAAGRRYEYSYGTDGGAMRLQRVVVYAQGGGTEVSRVEYDYCDATSGNGMAGDLRLVSVQTPCTPNSSNSSGSLVEETYYRTWAWSGGTPPANDGFTPGPQRSVRMVVAPEGLRRLKQAYPGNWDTQPDTVVAPYASLRLGYTSPVNGAVNLIQSAGRIEHRVEVQLTTLNINAAPFTSGYDPIWARRCVALERTGPASALTLYRAATFYFDEVGQSLSSVITPNDPGLGANTVQWTTRVERDTGGRVARIGSPAATSSYTHATGTFAASSAGLVQNFERQSAGAGNPAELTGFIARVTHAESWGGATTKDAQFAFESIGGTTRPCKTLAGYTVRRPLVHSSTVFPVGDGSDPGQTTTLEYHLPSAAQASDGSSLALTIDWLSSQHPVVSVPQHGSGASTMSAVAFRPEGRVTYARGTGDSHGPLMYFQYNLPGVVGSDDSGLVKSIIADVDASALPSPSEFPAGFPSGTVNPAPKAAATVYDPQGRVSVTHGPSGLHAHTAFQRLADGRAVVISATELAGTPGAFASPASFAIFNLAGAVEAGGSITYGPSPDFGEVASTCTPPQDWLNPASSDPLTCIMTGLIRSPRVVIYDASGLRPTEGRAYSEFSAGAGIYDAVTVAYDAIGRADYSVDPTGTIDRQTYDILDRIVSSQVGVSLSAMRPLATMEYDQGHSAANSLLTRIDQLDFPDVPTNRRTSEFRYDVLGRLRIAAAPAAPHALVAYDNLGRVVASGEYGGPPGTLLGYNAIAVDPRAIPTGRINLVEPAYDPLGRMYHSLETRGDEGDAVTSTTDTWFDPQGRITLFHGPKSIRIAYPDAVAGRRSTVRSLCVLGSLPSQYAQAMSVQATDVVLQEVHQVLDPLRLFVEATAVVDRHPDTGTLTSAMGPLSSAGFVDFATGNLDYTQAMSGRVSVIRHARDALNRTVKVVDFGNARFEPAMSTNPGFVNDPGIYGTEGFRPSLAGGVPPPQLGPTDEEYLPRGAFYRYDERGMMTTRWNERGDFTSYVFDDLGRRVRQWSALGDGLTLAGPNAADASTYSPERITFQYSHGRNILVQRVDATTQSVIATVMRTDYADTFGGSYPFASANPRNLVDNRLPLRTAIPGSFMGPGNQLTEDVRWSAHNNFGEVARTGDPSGTDWTWSRDPLGRALSVGLDYAQVPAGMNNLPEVDEIVSVVDFTYDGWGRLIAGEQFAAGGLLQSLGVSTRDICGCGCTSAISNQCHLPEAGGVKDPLAQGIAPPSVGSSLRTEYGRAWEGGASAGGDPTAWQGSRLASITPPGMAFPGIHLSFSDHLPDPSMFNLGAKTGRIGDITSLIDNDMQRSLAWYRYYGPGGEGSRPPQPERFSPTAMTPMIARSPEPDFGGDGGPVITPMIYHPPYEAEPAADRSWLLNPDGIYRDPAGTGLPDAGTQRWDYCACSQPIYPTGTLDPFSGTGVDRWDWCAAANCAPTALADPPIHEERVNEPDPRDMCACKDTYIQETDPRETKKTELIWCGVTKDTRGPDAAQLNGGLLLDLRSEETWEHDSNGNWTAHQYVQAPPASTNMTNVRLDQRTFTHADQSDSLAITRGAAAPTNHTPTYDRRGNLRDDGERFVYLYDAFNRLTHVYRRDPNGNAGSEYARFAYDAFGHRTSARYDDDNDGDLDEEPADLYGYDDQWRLTTVAEYLPPALAGNQDGRTFIRERFIYHASGDGESFSMGPSGTDAPLARFIDANGDGDYSDAGDRIDYYLTNRRGDVVAIVGPGTDLDSDGVMDVPGELRARVLYSTFGVPTLAHPLDMDRDGQVGPGDYVHDLAAMAEAVTRATQRAWANLASVNCITSPCGFDGSAAMAHFIANYPTTDLDLRADLGSFPLYAGYWWDPHLSMYHVRHRVYDPGAGRFLQRDPIGYAGGLNLYIYVGNMPYGFVDPMGLDATKLGNWLRGVGAGGVGELVDDTVDGASELADSVTGVRDAQDGAHAAAVQSMMIRQAEGVTSAGSQQFAQYAMFIAADIGAVGQVRGAEDDAIAHTTVDVVLVAASPLVPIGPALRGAGLVAGRVMATNTARSFVASQIIRFGSVRFGLETLVGREVSAGAGRAFFANAGTRAAGELLPRVHGNTAGNQWAYLYGRYDAQGNFLKWGVTRNMATRYSKKELAGGTLSKVAEGPRRLMLQQERELVETQPGPLNHERWAGCRQGQ
ncbi:MAG: RHS repeat-associated core domain-containing protein [Phycisphaerales bacterium]